MPTRFRRRARTGAVALTLTAAGLLLMASCSRTPRAPDLQDSPVYQSTREGIRFLVPEGWKQSARAEVPAGKIDKERLLVSYRKAIGGRMCDFELTLVDLPESTDLAGRLAERSYGAASWTPAGKAEPVEADGQTGQRYDLTARLGGEAVTKEVAVFRRGERVYFFTGLFPARDTKARDEVREIVKSIKWKS